MLAPANLQWAATGQPQPVAGQLGVGQPQGTVPGAAASGPSSRPAGPITQQQMQQHILAKGGAPTVGLAAVGQGQQPLYHTPAKYLQHGQLPAPTMPLGNRPPGASGAPFTGSVQTQGAWRPSAPFAAPPAAAAPQQQATSQPSVMAPAVHVGGVLPGAQAHVQQVEPGHDGMVTFAAEPVRQEPPPAAQHIVDSSGAVAEAPPAAAAGAAEGRTQTVIALEPEQPALQPGDPVTAAVSEPTGVSAVRTQAHALPVSHMLAAQLPKALPVADSA